MAEVLNPGETPCSVCPRRCLTVRSERRGCCGCDDKLRVAKTMLHMWEEPCVSGKGGAGAIFFTGCPLRCVYCQNKPLTNGEIEGKIYTSAALTAEMLSLCEAGAECIDLVSPTPYAPYLAEPLTEFRRLKSAVPIIWNTGGYELPSTVAALDGIADVYLTDFKYGTADFAEKYSNAPDYVENARAALAEMYGQTGKITFNDSGVAVRGVIVRHLVLPGGRFDSVRALETVADALGGDVSGVYLSLMSQYTPGFAPTEIRELNRRVCGFEYEYVRDAALSIGFKGYAQSRRSAVTAYTPDFF